MLLTVGDSFTVKRYDGDYPWGYQLADKLGMKHLNVAHEGESNSYIFRNTIWAITENPEISIVVLALTNWDRFELPYEDYGMALPGIDERTKTFKPKNAVNEFRHNDICKQYLTYYNPLFYVDATASYLISIDQMCKQRNIKLIVIQPLVPFNINIEELKSKEGDFHHILTKAISPHGEQYIKNFSLFQYVNKEIFLGFDPTPKVILYARDESVGKQLFHNFHRRHPENVMGFHNKYIYKDSYRFRNQWDGHPDIQGHELIANMVYKSIK